MRQGDSALLNAPPAVRNAVSREPHLTRLLEVFSKYFRANYCKMDESKSGAPFSFANLFLKPNPELAQQFGISREVLCFADESSIVDGRQFSYVDVILSRERNRLVDDVIFFVSSGSNMQAVADDYMERTGRKVICCTWRDLEAASEDFSYELLRQFLYNRDFFDVSDPVSSDGQFFARFKLVDSIFDNLSAGQNTGIFGLRKIGKTSVIKRLLVRNNTANRFRVAQIDAQTPLINKNDAAGVALEICRAFNASWARAHNAPFRRDIPASGSMVEASRYFTSFIESLGGQGKPLLVVIDELERILPNQTRSSTWNTEYLDLWRLLRAQSQTMAGKFAFLVASTNPYFIESAKFSGEDNPIYRFIKAHYLKMFTGEELSDMLRKLAQPMGITFSENALLAIHRYFGGHPFLSRQLCTALAADLPQRPLHVEDVNVQRTIQRHAAGFRDDLDAILKVFSDFYPDEFDLLSALGHDERKAIELLEQHAHAASHLLGYGLLQRTKNSFRFTMDALPPYLKTPRTREFTVPEIPDRARDRHLKLQSHMNSIEPAIRYLVLGQLRGKYGKSWQSELRLQAGTEEKIEKMGSQSAQEVMEETYLTDMIATINAHWALFARVFENREAFRQHAGHLTSIARGVSDHRKFAVCEDDAKYIRAVEACEWFGDKIL